ncbi:MAG TPA: hypothetical protein PKE69_23865 [Pyrinomonadaceae bacterium]|nr:hypothetical protein [Pyrinomonadaceae bacterium]
MQYRKIIIAVVLLSAMFGAFSSETVIAENESAKCYVFSYEEAFKSGKAVFVGKVLSEEKRGDTRYFEFEVEKYWKGANKKKIEIGVYETMRYQANFKTGERYLIYANANSEGTLSVGRCSRSRTAEQAEEDLDKLGTGKKPD